MPDEATPVEAPQTTEGQTAEPTPETTPTAASAPQAEQTTTWQQELERADAKALRSHPKVAGIIGSEIQRAIVAERQRIQADEGEKAARQAEAQLRELARTDPGEFAERWLSDEQKRDIQRQLDGMHGRARGELAQAVGRAMNDLPEWKELTETDHQKLAQELMGKSEEEVIPLFNRRAVEIVAERRARRMFEEWRTKERTKEREAIRQEEAAKLLRSGEAPDLAAPRGAPTGVNIQGMSDAEFDKYWNERHR